MRCSLQNVSAGSCKRRPRACRRRGQTRGGGEEEGGGGGEACLVNWGTANLVKKQTGVKADQSFLIVGFGTYVIIICFRALCALWPSNE